MNSEKAQFRIAEHVTDARPETIHGDLFILLPEAEWLVTYDIQGIDLLNLKDRFEHSTDLEILLGEGPILIKRKANHRLLYWTFSGPISGDRGTLSEVCRGWLKEVPHIWPDTTALKI